MSRINRYHVNGLLFGLSLWLCAPLTTAWGATVPCGPGDTACLVNAITAANTSGQDTTITLATGTYLLQAPASPFTGLPVITGTITITGAGAALTTLARDPAPSLGPFRLFEVGPSGTLTLSGLTLTGGGAYPMAGGAILTAGTLTLRDALVRGNQAMTGGAVSSHGTTHIERSRFEHNIAHFSGGALAVDGGELTLDRSTVAHNFAQGFGGGIANTFFFSAGGTVRIFNSAITENSSDLPGGGGIANDGVLELTSTTLSGNSEVSHFGRAGALYNGLGTATLTNCTVTGNFNVFGVFGATPAVFNEQGTVLLENTILALNAGAGGILGANCEGVITSLGANILGDRTGCTLTLAADDLTSDPLLNNLADDGLPGDAVWPLIAGSPAINAAHAAGCPATDQLGNPRVGRCDIGAVEFQPPGQRVARLTRPNR
jgi:hypothetical protein